METLHITIHKIKNIKHAEIDLPIKNGVFAIVGKNGCGKSTIMSCLAQLISPRNLDMLRDEDFSEDSYVEFLYKGIRDKWIVSQRYHQSVQTESPRSGIFKWMHENYQNKIRFNGTYEGSLFYGMRFEDSKIVDDIMQKGRFLETDIVPADDYIIKKLGAILHNNEYYYSKLKRVRNKKIAERFRLKNTPYFREISENTIISQYRLSSGECLLVSLLHFVYNSIIRRSLPEDKEIIMLIDEIELALHPIAIKNLIDLLESLSKDYENLTIIITSHSPEVIRRVNPNNIFNIEYIDSENQSLSIINPCYPSYAIRDIYTHDGFDYILLVEDVLAKKIVQNAIRELRLERSRLINIVPVGGYRNVLDLHLELQSKNILGVGRKIVSILDGDIQNSINKKYSALKKFFLPVPSIEKFIYKSVINEQNTYIKKEINDIFFTLTPFQEIINTYISQEKQTEQSLGERYKKDSDGKRFYNLVKTTIEHNKFTEDDFINEIYKIIRDTVNLEKFYQNLTLALS